MKINFSTVCLVLALGMLLTAHVAALRGGLGCGVVCPNGTYFMDVWIAWLWRSLVPKCSTNSASTVKKLGAKVHHFCAIWRFFVHSFGSTEGTFPAPHVLNTTVPFISRQQIIACRISPYDSKMVSGCLLRFLRNLGLLGVENLAEVNHSNAIDCWASSCISAASFEASNLYFVLKIVLASQFRGFLSWQVIMLFGIFPCSNVRLAGKTHHRRHLGT